MNIIDNEWKVEALFDPTTPLNENCNLYKQVRGKTVQGQHYAIISYFYILLTDTDKIKVDAVDTHYDRNWRNTYILFYIQIPKRFNLYAYEEEVEDYYVFKCDSGVFRFGNANPISTLYIYKPLP